jgi:hypothetical protein
MGGLQGYNQGGQVININVPPGGYTSTGGAALPGGAPSPGAGAKPLSGGLLNGGLMINPDHLDRIFTPPGSNANLSLRQVQEAFTQLYRKYGPNHPTTKKAFRNLQWANNEVQRDRS